MSRPVIVIEPNKTILQACKLMADRNIGCLIVVEKGSPVGIITERDIVNKVVAKNKDASKVSVETIMSTSVRTVETQDSVLSVSNIMRDNLFRRIVVMDAGHVAGVITARDLVRIYSS